MPKRHPKVRISMRRLRLLPETAKLGQVALILRVSASTVRNWMADGMKANKVGSSWQIRRPDVERYLRASHRLVG